MCVWHTRMYNRCVQGALVCERGWQVDRVSEHVCVRACGRLEVGAVCVRVCTQVHDLCVQGARGRVEGWQVHVCVGGWRWVT